MTLWLITVHPLIMVHHHAKSGYLRCVSLDKPLIHRHVIPTCDMWTDGHTDSTLSPSPSPTLHQIAVWYLYSLYICTHRISVQSAAAASRPQSLGPTSSAVVGLGPATSTAFACRHAKRPILSLTALNWQMMHGNRTDKYEQTSMSLGNGSWSHEVTSYIYFCTWENKT